MGKKLGGPRALIGVILTPLGTFMLNLESFLVIFSPCPAESASCTLSPSVRKRGLKPNFKLPYFIHSALDSAAEREGREGGRECLIIKTRRITLRKKEDTIMKLSTFLYH